MNSPPASGAAVTPPELIIECGYSGQHYWRDLWRFRELLGYLAWRDIKVRYKQAAFGAGWALLQPAATMVVFTFVFGRLANMPSGGVPYSLLVLAGLLPWQLFAAALIGTSNSVVGNSHLIAKVYFPRLVIPLSALGLALVDFAIVLVLFAVMAGFRGVLPGWPVLLLPAFIALALVLALGAGLWLTSLTVKYRDFRYLVPFLLQVGLFVSPIGFRAENYPNWHGLLVLNPMTGVIDGFRWCLLDASQTLDWIAIGYAVALAALLLVSGVWYFRKTERQFADVI